MTVNAPSGHANERDMLRGWLDLYRDIMLFKIEGLDEEQARFSPTPNGVPLLNLIVHLTGVERRWFQEIIGGRTVDRDRASEFGSLDVTVDDAIAAYRAECATSNEVYDSVDSLDQPCVGETGYSVRWVVHHVLEEIARHAGHADITRELIDGAVGFSRAMRD